MKLNETKANKYKYTVYALDDASRNKLLERFPPKYPEVVCHHVTQRYGFPDGEEVVPPPAAAVKIIGYADSTDGIEALVVSVDGKTERADGGRYHITLSLDTTKYTPIDSNKLLTSGKFTLTLPVAVTTTPTVI